MSVVPGGTFRMGSDNHYPEEAPVHRVTVDSCFIDRAPVTNAQFKQFVNETRHVTFAEVAPDPRVMPSRSTRQPVISDSGASFDSAAARRWQCSRLKSDR